MKRYTKNKMSLTKLKIIFLGNAGAGKTSFYSRLLKHDFNPEVSITIGIEFETLVFKYKEKKVEIHLWDTAGQERYLSLTRSLYLNTNVALIMVDLSTPQSSDGWFERAQDVQVWKEKIKSEGPENCTIIFVGTKADLNTEVSSICRTKDSESTNSFPLLHAESCYTGCSFYPVLQAAESLYITSSKNDPHSRFSNFLHYIIMAQLDTTLEKTKEISKRHESEIKKKDIVPRKNFNFCAIL